MNTFVQLISEKKLRVEMVFNWTNVVFEHAVRARVTTNSSRTVAHQRTVFRRSAGVVIYVFQKKKNPLLLI